jgi:hypothetical protein
MEGLQGYMETKITIVREQVDKAEATIAVVNGSLSTLRDRVEELQQSRNTRLS